MKHIKKILGAAAAAVLVVMLTSGSGVKGEVAELVCARTDILNGYFSGHINYYDALEQISQIETGRLLEEDILAMREFFQTDIEEVSDYEITEIEITYADDEMVCAVVKIDWKVFGTGNSEQIQGIYSTIIEKYEKKYKLVQFF